MPNKKTNWFQEFCDDLKAKEISAPKSVGKIELRQYTLIACEGTQTEPLYFEQWRKQLPKHLLNLIEIAPEGNNTIHVVRRAIEEREKRRNQRGKPNYDQVWAVFDKDDFPSEHYEAALRLAEENDILTAPSNQAFELWYILHFQYLEAALHRQQYSAILTKALGFPYIKNDTNVARELFKRPLIEQAIQGAKKLAALHEGTPPSQACPYTGVYKIVEEFLKFVPF